MWAIDGAVLAAVMLVCCRCFECVGHSWCCAGCSDVVGASSVWAIFGAVLVAVMLMWCRCFECVGHSWCCAGCSDVDVL